MKKKSSKGPKVRKAKLIKSQSKKSKSMLGGRRVSERKRKYSS